MNRLLIIISIAIANVASAQQYTLQECRNMALENSRKVASASEHQLMMDDELRSVKANFFPNFSLNGSYLFSNMSKTLTIEGGYLPTFVTNPETGSLDPNILTLNPDGTPLFKEYAYMPDQNFELELGGILTASVMAQQPIYMGGKVRSGVKMQSIGGELSKLNRQKTEVEVIAETDKAFYNYITAGESLKTAIKYRELIDTLSLQMERGVKAGMKTKNDQLKVEVELNRAKLMVMKVENLKRLALMNLCYNIGLPLTSSNIEVIEQNSTIYNIEYNQDVTGRIEYAMLEQQVELKRANKKFVSSDFKPQLAALASYGYTNGVKLNSAKIFNSASVTAGVTLRVPIFHFKEGRNKISAANREITIAENQLFELSELMTLELTQAINHYNEAVAEVALMQKSLESAEENMKVSRNMYNSGMEKLSDFLQAQTLWHEASTNLIAAESKAHISYTEYLKASGKLTSSK